MTGPGSGRAHDAVPTHPEAVDGDPHTLRWVVPAGLLGMVGPVGDCPAPLANLRAAGAVRVLVAEPDALRITLAPELNWRDEGARVRDALEIALAEAQRRQGGGERAFHPEPVPVPVPVSIIPAPGAANSAPLDAAAPATKTSAAPAAGAPQSPITAPDAAPGLPAVTSATAATGTVGSPDTPGSTGSPTASALPRDILAAAVDQVLGGDVGAYLASHGGRARVVAVTDDSVELELGGTCASCPARNFTMQSRVEAEIRRRFPALHEVRVK